MKIELKIIVVLQGTSMHIHLWYPDFYLFFAYKDCWDLCFFKFNKTLIYLQNDSRGIGVSMRLFT